jgi:hypothetical protein
MTLDLASALPIRSRPQGVPREGRMMWAFQTRFSAPDAAAWVVCRTSRRDVVETVWSSRLILSAVESGVFAELG